MRPIVLGTAGHIDHGKTALVRALTGIDTDRLAEEKRRGITIELGFAHLPLANGISAGVVDVPGHERLVRRMVSGATGIDLVLLAVAADEGVMPQTREHFHICQYLALRRGVVALTKRDLVDAEIAAAAEEEVRDYLKGTFLERARIVPVSTLTGEGLEELRAEIARLAAEAAADPPRAAGTVPRLPIDRVFTMKGFGTVVTGTLVAGTLRTGEEVELLPARLPARIRGLQSYNRAVEVVSAGSRVAANLQGIDRLAVERGMVLSTPGSLEPTALLDCQVAILDQARPLRSNARVRLHAGTRESQGRLLLLDREVLKPGDECFAQVVLDNEIVALPGDRFILRGFSWLPGLGQTMGGGRVLDAHPPQHRSFSASPRVKARLVPVIRALETLADGNTVDALRIRIARAGTQGLSRAHLGTRVALSADEVETALQAMIRSGEIVAGSEGRGGETLYLSREARDDLVDRIVDTVRAYHASSPTEAGIPREALRSRIPRGMEQGELDARVLRLALEEAARRGDLKIDGDRVRSATHEISHTAEETTLMNQLEQRLAEAGLEPPTFREFEASMAQPREELLRALVHLCRNRGIVRVKDDLYFHSGAVDDLARRVVAHLRERGEITPAEYKALTGASRKFTVPLMEHFDNEKLTIRTGEVRKLRRIQ